VTVFGPHPLLTVTIEPFGARGDDIHLHAGGQGVWVARMAAELGALPVLCGFTGGRTRRRPTRRSSPTDDSAEHESGGDD
jgi:1-phosphofructokinase